MHAMTLSDMLKLVIHPLGVGFFGLWFLSWIIQSMRRNSRSTPLRGPPRNNLLFGVSADIHTSPDSSVLFEKWAEEYGSVYRIPYSFGTSQIILADPKAVAGFYAQDSFVYVRSPISRRALERFIGRNLIWVEGEDHKRKRKALSPAFNNAAIRKLTPIFFDSAYKVKAAWEGLIDSTKSGEALIDIQNWMNCVSLDTIGIAGFSHDFRTLYGEPAETKMAFDSLAGIKFTLVDRLKFMLSEVLPIIALIPTNRTSLALRLGDSLKHVAEKLLADSEEAGDQKPEDKSIIGVLVNEAKGKGSGGESDLFTPDEITSQMRLLLVAGYETTSASLTWALLELAQRTDAQARLREEVSQFSAVDPNWDQLSGSSLPYLDAVVHEILRLQPAAPETPRVAIKDDILQLSSPVRTRDGQLVNSVAIAKGTPIIVNIRAVNRSEAFWGPDAKEFKPERWLTEDGIVGAKDIQAYRHLLTFSDGPRTCLGKAFAVTEFKAVLCTLIKNFTFEMKEGAKVEFSRGLLPRPKIVGEEGLSVPIRVRRVE